MGEYEPDDSRIVTQVPSEAPGEPPRTGPREDQARKQAKRRDESEVLEEEGQHTARDAMGEKQHGFGDEDEDETSDEEPPLGK